MPRKSLFLLLSPLSLSLSLSDSSLSPFYFSPSFLFFSFLSFLIHPHFLLLFVPSSSLFISFHFLFSHFLFFLSFFFLFLFFFIFSFLLLLASPTRMDQVGETSPHFPPWPLVITMFFFLIFFIFFFPFITLCNTWLNVSHLFQVHHMTLAMCRSLGVPYGIHMIMSCVTRDASKNMKFCLSQNLTKFNRVTRFRGTNSMVKSVSSSEI